MSEASDARAELRSTLADDGFGRVMTLRRMDAGTADIYDPTTGTTSPVSGDPPFADYTGFGRLGTYSDFAQINTLIKAQDRKCTFVPDEAYIAALVPQIDDLLIVGADVYSVIKSAPLELAGEYICFTLQIRR